MERHARLARYLVADLEDFYVQPPDYSSPDYDPQYATEEGVRTYHQHNRVVNHPATKRKLEEWFARRNIPIRIVVAEAYEVSAIGKKGVITLHYYPHFADPPTAWMIVHNLSHAIHEPRDPNPDSPYGSYRVEKTLDELEGKRPSTYPRQWAQHYNLMGEDPTRPSLYPTTKSQQRGKISDPGEAFHELFTQWVVKGQVILKPRNPALEKELATSFRQQIDELAASGAVLYNN